MTADTLWTFDCDYGQGLIRAESEEAARRAAVREAGTYSQVRNVRQATPDEIAWRRGMSGTTTA